MKYRVRKRITMLYPSDVDTNKNTSISFSFVLFVFVPHLLRTTLGQCDENDMYAKSDNQKCRSFFLSGGDMLVTNVYLMPSRFSPLQGWHPNIVATWRIDPRWICRHLRTCAPVPSTRHRKGWIDSAPFLCKRSSLIALRCGRRL